MTHSPTVTNPEQAYLSSKAVARRLGVHPETVRRWIASGRLPATKIGKDYRILVRDLAAARTTR